MKWNIAILLIGATLIVACEKKQEQSQTPAILQSEQQQMPPGHPSIGTAGANSAAGVSWTVPPAWTAGPERQMRVATYNISAAQGDAEGGECGVFFFGSGQGGDIGMNIERWADQFEKPKGPQRTSEEVNGLKVELVKISGTYLAPSGPMMESSGTKENYRLLGAIVTAPEGSVFFKLTGPAKTIAAAEKDFNALVQSLTK